MPAAECTQSQKVCVCGVELPVEVTWTNWRAGKEYKKNVAIKNPCYEPRKIKARMPPSRIFKMIHTEKIFVAPGNVVLLPVSFFPQEEVEYCEKLELKNELGCFCLTLRAVPHHSADVWLTIPPSVDVGMCAVGHVASVTFDVVNTCPRDTEVSVESVHPIAVEPERFLLPAGQHQPLRATFSPNAAKKFSVNVVLRYGNNFDKSSCCVVTGRSMYAVIMAFACQSSCCNAKNTKCLATNICNGCNCDPDPSSSNNNSCNDNNNIDNINDDKSLTQNDTSKGRARLKSERSKGSRKEVIKAVKTHNYKNSNSRVAGVVDSGDKASSNNNNDVDDANGGTDQTVSGCTRMMLDFGEVAPGQKSKKHIIVKNMSAVDSFYTLSVPRYVRGPCTCGDEDDCGPEKIFRFENGQGFLKAGCYQEATIMFGPREPGLTYKVEVVLQSSSATTDRIFPRTSVTCIGRCSAPKVFLCRRLLCFPAVELPGSVTKNLEIINQSLCPAYFQFQVNNLNSSFRVEPSNGRVPAMGRTGVKVTFAPRVPINYYRKVACLVHNKGVLFLHLMGTCRSGDIVPVALSASHLARYECFRRQGISYMSPQQITMMHDMDSRPEGTITNMDERLESISTGNDDDEFMDDGCTLDVVRCMPHVSTDVNVIDFGGLDFGCPPTVKDLCLTNHTKGAITVQWVHCSRVFSVSPSRKVIGGEQSAMFAFSFKPTEQSRLYWEEFECYSTPESFSSHKHTDERIFFPPWCVAISLSGHSFGFGCETFRPVAKFDRPVLTLRSTGRDRGPTFGTARISNEGTEPIAFQLEKDMKGMFLHKPSLGLVEPGANQIVLFAFNPRILDPPSMKIDRSLAATLNYRSFYDRPIKIKASISAPSVTFGSGGVLGMRPAYTGLEGRAKETVTNSCCSPLRFKWVVPVQYERALRVEPPEGFLGPYETQLHEWTFKSCHYEDKVIKAKLLAKLVPPNYGRRGGGGGGEGNRGNGCGEDSGWCFFSLKIVARGSRAKLTAKEDLINLDPLLVGSRHALHLTEISNDYACDVSYRLHVTEEVATPTTRALTTSCVPNVNDEDDDDCDAGEGRTRYKSSSCPALLRVFPREGVLHSRTRQEIHCVVDPPDRRHYRWRVSYTLHDRQGNTLDVQPEEELFRVLGRGIIPELSLVDVCTRGSAKCLSRSYVWRMFSIDRLNSQIKHDLGNDTKRFSQSQKNALDFHFPAGPIGMKACIFVPVFQNCGLVPCEWKVFLPSDLKAEVDKWAESGQLSPEDYHEMEIVDNQLFNFFPNSGRLEPGQSCSVTLRYEHLLCGVHTLPLLLRVKDGNEVKINLRGTTVERGTPWLDLPLREFRLEPVFVGTCQGPLQTFEFLNAGSERIAFTVDSSNVEELVKANYGFRVMECLTTGGCVEPYHMGTIAMRLNPIESKLYSVDLVIHVDGGPSYPITVLGEGKDHRCTASKSDQTCSSVSTSSIPDRQSCLEPDQVCRLSINRLDFGNLPLFSTARRIVTLTNTSSQHSVRYNWSIKNPDHARVVKVEPSCGRLNPCESEVLKVVLTSGEQPSITEADLICETTNLTEMAKFEQDLETFVNLRHKLMTDVDFSEVSHDQDVNCIRNVEFEGHPYGDELVEEVKFPKYKTLPPIVKSEPRTDERVARKTRRCFVERPKTPVPDLQFLSVKARTHDLQEFKTLFPGCLRRHFIDRCIGCHGEEEKSKGGCHEGRGTGPRLNTRQFKVIDGIFRSLLRDLLDDESFVSSCVEVAGEPMPYFQQFMEEKEEPADPCRPITNVRYSETGEEIAGQAIQEVVSVESEETLKKRERMKSSPEFGILCEGMLEDTLFNIIQEAYHGEFCITARPRLVALGRDRQPMAGCEASED